MRAVTVEGLLNALAEPSLVVTGKGAILCANRAARRMIEELGLEREPSSLIDFGTSAKQVREWLWICCSCREPVPMTLLIEGANGQSVAYRAEGSLAEPNPNPDDARILVRLYFNEDKTQRFMALNRRIFTLDSELRQTKSDARLLEFKATHDALTGLSNREGFLAQAEAALKRPPAGQPMALILADLDHFKAINDTYGHLAGDEVLREVARRLQRTVRSTDLCGRYGGEEFIVLASGASFDALLAVAERLRLSISAEPMRAGNEVLTVTLSAGLCFFPCQPNPAADLSRLISHADQALYRAKNDGRNAVRHVTLA
ncbi:MAG: GGDEF domain-containing protein [Sumerlaeia bacterium]